MKTIETSIMIIEEPMDARASESSQEPACGSQQNFEKNRASRPDFFQNSAVHHFFIALAGLGPGPGPGLGPLARPWAS